MRRGGEPVKKQVVHLGSSMMDVLEAGGGRRRVQCGRSVSRVTKANYGPPTVPGERRIVDECMG